MSVVKWEASCSMEDLEFKTKMAKSHIYTVSAILNEYLIQVLKVGTVGRPNHQQLRIVSEELQHVLKFQLQSTRIF
jgi:hypothetical protein